MTDPEKTHISKEAIDHGALNQQRQTAISQLDLVILNQEIRQGFRRQRGVALEQLDKQISDMAEAKSST